MLLLQILLDKPSVAACLQSAVIIAGTGLLERDEGKYMTCVLLQVNDLLNPIHITK